MKYLIHTKKCFLQNKSFFVMRMMKCLCILILFQGQRIKHFVSLASAAEHADASSQNLATPNSHSFHTNDIKLCTHSVQLTSSVR